MMIVVRVHPAASRDVRGHVQYLANHSARAAGNFGLAMRAAYQRLSELPEIGAKWRPIEPSLQEVRRWPVPGFPTYLLYYRITAEGVEIVRVLHSKRDVEQILGADRVQESMPPKWGFATVRAVA